MPQFAKLHNHGSIEFDFHYHNEKRIIKPGGDAIVPWDLATTLFGDPGEADLPRDARRTATYRRIRNLYGYLEGMETSESWEARRPKIHVYDLETSERIYMTIEDPQGLHAYNAPVEGQSEIEMLTRQIQSLTQTVNALLAKTTSETAEASGDTVIPSTDAPNDPALDGTLEVVPDLDLPVSVPRPPKNNPKAPKNVLKSGASDLDEVVSLDLSVPPEEPSIDGPPSIPVLPPRS